LPDPAVSQVTARTVTLPSAKVNCVPFSGKSKAYTDGGVFDNLGVRMFRCLERPLLADSLLSRDDFVDFPGAIGALRDASRSSAQTPLHRLAQLLIMSWKQPDLKLLPNFGTSSSVLTPSPVAKEDHNEELLLSSLWKVMREYQFQLDPLFASLNAEVPDTEALHHVNGLSGRALDPGDQLWLNRHVLEAAFRQAAGHPCFRRLDSGLDGVLVSDVGKPIEVLGNRHPGGMIRTTLRASDILMDRVWQLEKDTPGFVFAPITEVVEPTEDPTALHPEIQRQAAHIRTDLDRFSVLEISRLVRHGYCVGRKACRTRPDLFGSDLPESAPWDPIARPRNGALSDPAATRLDRSSRGPTPPTTESRKLQASALRRVWSTLLDYRDWVSYLYVPILIPILVLLPLVVVKSYERSHRLNQLINSLSQGSPDLEVMSRLLEGSVKPWIGVNAEEVRTRPMSARAVRPQSWNRQQTAREARSGTKRRSRRGRPGGRGW